GADRNLQNDIFAITASFLRAFPMSSTLGFVFGIETKMHERVVAFAGFHPHIAALTTIAARRSPARNELLPTKGHTPVSAVAGLHPDFRFIDEHRRPVASSSFSGWRTSRKKKSPSRKGAW